MLATSRSVVARTFVVEVVMKAGIERASILAEIIPSFCGAFVAGILSCASVYFLDRAPLVRKLAEFLNKIAPFYEANKLIDYFKRQAVFFEEYAARLMNLDVEKLKKK